MPKITELDLKRGKRFVPLDCDIKAIAFRVSQAGGLRPDDIFGHYEYADGHTRETRIKLATLEAHWTPARAGQEG